MQEHYAIIPTEKIPKELSLESNIYLAVVLNTILMFAADNEYEVTTVIIKVNDLEFCAKGNMEQLY